MGKSLGGQAPYGYEWKDKKIVINEKEATIRKLLYDLFLEHKRRKTVATILNKMGYRTRNKSRFSDTTVTRLLEDPIAKGLRRVNYTESTGDNKHWIYKNKEEWIFQEVPAIISEEKWEKVNSIITELSKTHKKPLNKKINIFTGFLLCSCGNRMFAISGPHYKCCKCQNKIPKTDIEEIFHQQLTNYIISNDKLDDYINASKSIIIEKENQLKILQKEAQQIQSKMDNLLDLHLRGEIPTDGFKHHHNPLYEQLKQIEAQTPIIEGEILAMKQKLSMTNGKPSQKMKREILLNL
ncbi:MAG: recombinase family protein [Bacteroidales bacterium]